MVNKLRIKFKVNAIDNAVIKNEVTLAQKSENPACPRLSVAFAAAACGVERQVGWPVWLGRLENGRLANVEIPTDLQPADQE